MVIIEVRQSDRLHVNPAIAQDQFALTKWVKVIEYNVLSRQVMLNDNEMRNCVLFRQASIKC